MADANITGSPAIVSMVGSGGMSPHTANGRPAYFKEYTKKMFNNEDNEKPKSIRDILHSLGPEEAYERIQEMRNNPMWKAGYDEGVAVTTEMVKREYQTTIQHLVELIQTQEN